MYQHNRDWLLIPFYSDPSLPGYGDSVGRFRDFAERSKDISGLNLAVVDDGSRLNPEEFREFTDLLVQIPVNEGKASALRKGLDVLLKDPDIDPEFIVQYDGDGDQSYVDIPHFVRKLEETAEGDSSKPALVIGDRYSERLSTPPNPDSVSYRQSLLIFFGSIAGQLGYDIKDWVSGARGYTAEYARRFLERSSSNSYGVEAEQLVVAYLEGASVGRVPLAFSRPRDPNSERSKWLQNFDAFLLYSDELRNRGMGHMVDTLEELTGNLRGEKDYFDLDLSSIGEETVMHFERQGTAYAAEIPGAYRSRYFNGEGPFIARREIQR